ncbi:MAG TPA: hypothetical protein VNO30_32950 [Kofleriaceae bacterium]|nr:hypothetical protein [Kofleriaceae bacterium]
MAHASPSARTLLALAVTAGLLSATNAAADESGGGGGGERGRAVVPARCALFAAGEGAADSAHTWQELLSLAACLQDASVAAVGEPGELVPMVEALSRRLAPPMRIYLAALERGDALIQLRATFQIGMAYVALATRARSSIVVPAGAEADGDAARRHRELHARLEPLLVPARRAAWVAFRAIDEAAAEDGTLAGSELDRGMIRAAREMLPALRDAAPGAEPVTEPRAEPRPITAAAR